MSRYVQTFSERDQAILNHAAFQPFARYFTKAEAEKPITALWFNSGLTHLSFPDSNQDLPRIRYGDVTAFRGTWNRDRPQNVILDGLLRGHFAPDKWARYEGGYAALILAYRTFQLWVRSETPGHAVEVSILDVDQVLASCSESFQGDEMPTCTGEWARGDERVQWRLDATTRPELDRMIRFNREEIDKAIRMEHIERYDIVIALRRFYRPVDERLPTAVLQENQASNARLNELFTRLGVCLETVWSLPSARTPFDEFASVEELVHAYQASSDRSVALDYDYFGVP